MKKKDYATQGGMDAHAGTRLNIIDEIFFADYDEILAKTSANLQAFTEHRSSISAGKAALSFSVIFANSRPSGTTVFTSTVTTYTGNRHSTAWSS
jgi:hypothetical protein